MVAMCGIAESMRTLKKEFEHVQRIVLIAMRHLVAFVTGHQQTHEYTSNNKFRYF